MTWVKGKHTLKSGGSLTLRSREILNADSITGVFNFNNNMTSNCAGQRRRLRRQQRDGLRRRELHAGPGEHEEPRPVRRQHLHREAAGYTLYVQDDYRVTNRLTMNLGLRWDVYVPWVEKDNRQSNFDETTGKFVVASDDAVIAGVEVGRYLQTYSKRDLGPRFGFAYDLNGNGKTLVRGGFGVFWNFTPGGTSSSKAQNPPFLQSTSLNANPTAYGSNLLLKDGLPAPPGVDPNRPAAGTTRSIFDINFRDALCAAVEHQRPALALHELHAGSGLRRIAGPQHAGQGRPQPGAARRRRDRLERESALRDALAGAADGRSGAGQGHAGLQRAAA